MLPNLPEDLLDRVKQLERRIQRTSTAATTTPLPTWQTLPLAAGVVTNSATPQYRVQGSLLIVRGDVKLGSGSSIAEGAVLATLPAGARPLRLDTHPVATPNTTASRADVGPTGSVVYHGSSATWVALNFVVALN
jgi:hypothetical protein